ncbi:DUF4417 domain-containing protein [Fibrobacter sp.]|uniref:DUF4417 domain-containing protein n=1 Tax=Fibrobacter sp. TaxID=35828 RepID=UPI0025BA2CDA|nr:DUF4417 domain-containing protein [Fibrobacter sp.]MBR4006441.1 DUF4417 domain-containing protein [Fibrobacter sp.]
MKNEIPFIAKWALLFRNQKYPRIYRQKINLHGKRFVLINEISKIPPEERKNYILLFYAEEKHFNAFYADLNQHRIEILQEFYAVCGLDFSTYPGLDEEENIVAIKRNRQFCSFCQQNDILCIYNIVWTNKNSYKFAFRNIEKECVVIISTYRLQKDDDEVFRKGYLKMKQTIHPSIILCYGEPQKVMENDVSKGLVKRVPPRFELLKLEYAEKSGQYSFLEALLSA